MYKPIIRNKKFITYDEKPVYSDDYHASSDDLKNPVCLAIVMQGQIKLQNDFTYETLKLYKKTFKDCPLILSTWKTEDQKAIEKIKSLGVDVILNDDPSVKDFANINRQIFSTQQGLSFAKTKCVDYVIKTRTDQRLYETNIPEYLFNVLKTFPAYDGNVQKSRLITISFNTFKYRLYDINDMFLFGHIDEVIKFWSCEFETRTEIPKFDNLLEYCKWRPSEIYFTTEYLKKLGYKYDWTLKDSWNAYARYFCVIDSESVGFYWPKYFNFTNYWRNFLGANPELEELTFKEWLNLYAGIDNKINIADKSLVDGFENNSTLKLNNDYFIM